MKKYEKPKIYIENLRLAKHIAACNIQLMSTIAEGCTGSGSISNDPFWNGSSDSFFLNTNTSCSAQLEVYCYTNAENNNILINS